jgi:hypothetical protein
MHRVLDDFATPWQADPSGLWTVTSSQAAARFSGTGMTIAATAGATPAPAPSASSTPAAALDLRDADELRLWLRSSRAGDGAPVRPAYLAIEATRNPPTAQTWSRVLPIRRADTWELHRLWVGDMPATLRRAVGVLRLRSLDATVGFRADVAELLAVLPQPIADVETALLDRLDGTYSVDVSGTATPVPALVDVPENPGTPTAPYILVTPWSAFTVGPLGAGRDVVDNLTSAGAHVRPAPATLRLEYRIDVFADERAHKTAVLEGLVVDMLRPLVVAGRPITVEPFDAGGDGAGAAAGRTPLFYRLLVPIETGAPEFHDSARPFLTVGHADDRPGAEAVPA